MTQSNNTTPDEMKNKIDLFRGSLVREKKDTMPKGINIIITVISDLFGGLLVGAGIGYLLYRFYGVHRLVFAIFILLGGLAGLLNIYKSVRHVEKDG